MLEDLATFAPNRAVCCSNQTIIRVACLWSGDERGRVLGDGVEGGRRPPVRLRLAASRCAAPTGRSSEPRAC